MDLSTRIMISDLLDNIKKRMLESMAMLFYFAVAGLTIYIFAVEVSLVLQQSSVADLHAASPDESLFLGFGDIWQFASGYGTVFWGPLKLIYKHAPEGNNLEFTRLIYILFKYLAWAVLFAFFYKKYGRAYAFSLLFLLVTTPGYLFFGKIISPEYLLLLLTAIAAVLLFQDDGKLESGYFFSVLFSSLAVATKITALPLLAVVLLYGVVHGYRRRLPCKVVLSFVGKTLIALIIVWGPVIYFASFDEVRRQISAVLALAPPAQIDGRLMLAWGTDLMTWDQIKIGGIKPDFLAVAGFCSMALFSSLFFIRSKFKLSLSAILILVAAVLTFIPLFLKGMSWGWYLFLPVLLFVLATFKFIGDSHNKISLFLATIVASGVFIHSGYHRLQQRIELKQTNNNALFSNEISMYELRSYIESNLSCITTVNLDILVPEVSSHIQFIPVKDALNYRGRGIWTMPDLLVINADLHQVNQSPLINFVVKGDIDKFEKLKDIGDLQLYVNKSLGCLG